MNIDQEYLLRCKDSVGGVKEVYLFSYINYPRTQLVINDNELQRFPKTTTYKMEGLFNASFTDSATETEAGYEYTPTLNLTFSKLDTYYNFTKVVQGVVRALVLDNNDTWHLLGVYNGLDVSNYGRQSGSSKSELNGTTITLTGRERVQAPTVKTPTIITGRYNTRLLGQGAVTTTDSDLATLLGISGNNITYFEVFNGLDIECFIDTDYAIADDTFVDNINITRHND